jgi:hypothetical protein
MVRMLYVLAMVVALGGGPPAASDSSVAATVPFELVDNRIFVEVRIDGKGPFKVIFDTGAGNILRPEVARGLGLAVEDAGTGSGVGEQVVRAGRSTVGRMQLGSIVLVDQRFTILPFDDARHVFGSARFDGVIGYEVLQKYVATIDYERGRLTLTEPSKFEYRGTGAVVPFDDGWRIPRVQGALDGIAGTFAIDTGARSALILFGPFVDRNDLRTKYGAKLEGITGWGIGGPVRSQVVRVRKLTLGPVEVGDLVARLSTQKSGALTREDTAALVGPDVLKQFTLVVDYSRKRLIFEKNGNFGKPDVYDRTGMWMGQNDSGFEVLDVTAGGPAAAAGLAVGDTILSVDGARADRLVLPAVRLRFRTDAPGTRVRMRVLSTGKERDVTLTLRDLV